MRVAALVLGAGRGERLGRDVPKAFVPLAGRPLIAHALATGAANAEPGAEIPMGRMGSVTLDDTNAAAMADPFVYDASNIDQFKSIF